MGLGLALLNPKPEVLPDPPRVDPKLESPDDDDVPKEPMEARALNGRAPGVFAAGCGATVGSGGAGACRRLERTVPRAARCGRAPLGAAGLLVEHLERGHQ